MTIEPFDETDLDFIAEAANRAFEAAQDALVDGDRVEFEQAKLEHTQWGALHCRIFNNQTLH